MSEAELLPPVPPEELEAGKEALMPGSRDHFDVLQAAHEIDWRFLLPDPRLGRIAYFGERNDDLLAKLAWFAGSVESLDTKERRSAGSSSYEGVIVAPEALDDLAGAAMLVRAGGWLYAELPSQLWRRWLTRSSPAFRRRALLRFGFARVETHWHFPGFRFRRAIVPLGERAALRTALSRGESTFADRVKTGMAKLVAKLGLFEHLARHVSVVGVMPRDETGVQGAINAFIGGRHDELGLERYGFGSSEISYLLVTPPDVTSSHVIALLGPRNREPTLVAKLPRLPRCRAQLVREAGNLDALHRAWPAVRGCVPEVVALSLSDDFPVLLETTVSGKPLDPARVRRDPVAAVDSVVEWLGAFAEATKAPTEPGAYARLIEVPLEMLETFLSLDSFSAAVDQTLQCLAPLRTPEMFSVFEHGDLAHPNVILTGENKVHAVDWERADPRGLPAHDLIFFLSFVAFAKRHAHTAEERTAAFDEAFCGNSAWGRSILAGYADRVGLDRSLLAPSIVACWARYTAGIAVGLLDRLQTASLAARHYVTDSWETAIWRHAVEHADELMWTS